MDAPRDAVTPLPAVAAAVFTLVELLVVIAIIALLAGLMLPVLSGVRQKSRAAECAGQVRQLGIALHAYAGDYRDHLPICTRLNPAFGLPSLREVLLPYLEGAAKVFHCPSDRGSPPLFADVGTSYEWNTFVSGRRVDHASWSIIGLQVITPILGDAEAFHGPSGRNYLYSDGRVTPSLDILITNQPP